MTPSTSSTIDLLSPIWERVLRHAPIAAEDNFFDLGGDSSLALELFTEIAQACGRELPPVVIYQAPTLAALAALLEQPATPKLPPLVLLKSGAKPPLFLAHGLGGSVMDFFQPVKHIEGGHAIYGMQAKGMEGVEEPLDSIEDMAQFYIEGIRALQPHGPYLLIGYSLGGLVALEMAQQLSEAGEDIGLLAMIDAYPHMRHLSLGQRARLIARHTRRGLSALGGLGGGAPYEPPAGVSLSPAMQRLRDRAYVALERYQPRFYRGKISFIRAEVNTSFPQDPSAVWARLAGQFVVETVPGDHLGIMTTHFEELASVLSRYLQGASHGG